MRAEPSPWLFASAIAIGLSSPFPAQAADLNLIPAAEVVATNVALFLLLIYPVNRLLVQPLLRVLDERAARTSGALAESQQLGDDARTARTDLEARQNEARARAQAKRSAILGEGELEERAVLEAARDDAAQSIESVRRSIDGELVEARTALQADARALAREAATRILGRAL
ncbi:MAG: ATP synthase F0 subunit B [Myxococcota bacterium]